MAGRKPHMSNPRAQRAIRDRHQAIERAEKAELRRVRKIWHEADRVDDAD